MGSMRLHQRRQLTLAYLRQRICATEWTGLHEGKKNDFATVLGPRGEAVSLGIVEGEPSGLSARRRHHVDIACDPAPFLVMNAPCKPSGEKAGP